MDALKDAVGDAVGSLIEAFQEDMLIYLENLNIAIDNDDESQIRQIAHTIKGSASNFGAYDLVKHSKELEDRATRQQYRKCRRLRPAHQPGFRCSQYRPAAGDVAN